MCGTCQRIASIIDLPIEFPHHVQTLSMDKPSNHAGFRETGRTDDPHEATAPAILRNLDDSLTTATALIASLEVAR